MNEIQQKIVEALAQSSSKGKIMLYPSDLAKKVGKGFRAIKKDVQSLVEQGRLAYFHTGSSTYILLREDLDRKKRAMEEGQGMPV